MRVFLFSNVCVKGVVFLQTKKDEVYLVFPSLLLTNLAGNQWLYVPRMSSSCTRFEKGEDEATVLLGSCVRIRKNEDPPGFEPGTIRTAAECSTTEL